MSIVESGGGISRRTLVKSTALGSLALAAGSFFAAFWHADRCCSGSKRPATRRG